MLAETRIEVLDPPEASNKDPRSFRPGSLEEIHAMNEYRPLCCGSSGKDVLLIAACYTAFYSLALGLFALLLKGALQTDDVHQTLLWSFLVIGVIFACLVGGAVHIGMMHLDREKKAKKAMERAKKKEDPAT